MLKYGRNKRQHSNFKRSEDTKLFSEILLCQLLFGYHPLSYRFQVIGNGSFGVVYLAKLADTNELVAIKKVLQDKRFKVNLTFCNQ